jgi:hypothetical protein
LVPASYARDSGIRFRFWKWQEISVVLARRHILWQILHVMCSIRLAGGGVAPAPALSLLPGECTGQYSTRYNFGGIGMGRRLAWCHAKVMAQNRP